MATIYGFLGGNADACFKSVVFVRSGGLVVAKGEELLGERLSQWKDVQSTLKREMTYNTDTIHHTLISPTLRIMRNCSYHFCKEFLFQTHRP